MYFKVIVIGSIYVDFKIRNFVHLHINCFEWLFICHFGLPMILENNWYPPVNYQFNQLPALHFTFQILIFLFHRKLTIRVISFIYRTPCFSSPHFPRFHDIRTQNCIENHVFPWLGTYWFLTILDITISSPLILHGFPSTSN